MRGDAFHGVTSHEESIADGAPSHCNANIPIGDPCHSSGGVVHCIEIRAGWMMSEVGNATCKCRDWAYWPPKGVVVDDCALGAVLGVCNADCGAICSDECCERCRVWEELTVSPQSNVATADWNGPFVAWGSWARVFSNSQ